MEEMLDGTLLDLRFEGHESFNVRVFSFSDESHFVNCADSYHKEIQLCIDTCTLDKKIKHFHFVVLGGIEWPSN